MTSLISSPTKPSKKLPDGPKGPPLIQTIQGLLWPIESLEASRDRYGDIFTSRSIGFKPIVILSHPQAIQTIFTADPNLFESGKGNWLVQPLLGDNSLLLLDGPPHQRQRRLLTPPFHGERMRAYGQVICDLTQQVMSQQDIGKPFCIHSSAQEISLRVILRTVFGLEDGERYQQLRQLVVSLLDTFNSPWRSSLLFVRFLQKDLGALESLGTVSAHKTTH